MSDTTTKPTIHQPPELDIDAKMLRDYGNKLTPSQVRERRIVWNLLKHLDAAGFKPIAVDQDEWVPVADAKEAMERAFELTDGADVMFTNKRSVRLIWGNDVDVISDWTYGRNDLDGFNLSLNAFDPEAFA